MISRMKFYVCQERSRRAISPRALCMPSTRSLASASLASIRSYSASLSVTDTYGRPGYLCGAHRAGILRYAFRPPSSQPVTGMASSQIYPQFFQHKRSTKFTDRGSRTRTEYSQPPSFTTGSRSAVVVRGDRECFPRVRSARAAARGGVGPTLGWGTRSPAAGRSLFPG